MKLRRESRVCSTDICHLGYDLITRCMPTLGEQILNFLPSGEFTNPPTNNEREAGLRKCIMRSLIRAAESYAIYSIKLPCCAYRNPTNEKPKLHDRSKSKKGRSTYSLLLLNISRHELCISIYIQ